MSVTYSGNPAASNRDWIRFKVGDTDVTNADFQDAEIDAMLAEHATRIGAAYACAMARARKFERIALGAASEELEGIVREAFLRAADLLSEGVREGIEVSLPAADVSSKSDAVEDSDRVQERFSRGQFDLGEQSAYTSDDDVAI